MARLVPGTPDLDTETPFEEKETTVNGVSISLCESKDYESDDLHTVYELIFGEDGNYETVRVSSAVIAKELFEHAVANVPEDHPQKLYIAYGMTKQLARQKEREAEEGREIQREAAEAAHRATLDTSYSEAVNTNHGTISICWNDDYGEHGAYVIVFPGGNEFPVTMRPDVAKKFFADAVAMIKRGDGERDIESYLRSLRDEYDPEFPSSQDPKISHPDIFYSESKETPAGEISVGWNMRTHRFEVFFQGISDDMENARERHDIYDPIVVVGKSTEDAKKLFEYACQQAEEKHGDVIATYKAVDDMARSLRRDSDDD